jgi:SAM-dependent methyltransferase
MTNTPTTAALSVTPAPATAHAMEREDWNLRYAATEFVWTVKANRFLMDEVVGLAPGRALDLAAGEGRNAVWLAEQGWQVQSVDFADLALAKGRRLAEERNVASQVVFQDADLRTYVPAAGSFDLVVVAYLQIPQAELQPILARAATALAPGGIFLLIGHDTLNLTEGHGGPQNPAVLYSAEQVVAALGAGLVVEKSGWVNRAVDTGAGIRFAIDCLVRAKRPA